MTGDRRDELARRLAALRGRLAAACRSAGRDPAEITLVAVTKTFPAADVLHLADLGVSDFGENKDQEAAAKAASVTAAGAAVRWHFIGRLQRNKCRSVARYAHLVHSVDSARLVAALDAAAGAERDHPLEVLVQVSVDGDTARGGVPESGLAEVVEAVTAATALRLRGLMAVAPLGWAPEDAYARLAALSRQLVADHPDATVVSAGMTGDLEAAIVAGATHVRIGGAILGNRPSPAVT